VVRVTVNDLVKTVHENESIGSVVHRLEKPGKILELFGEDDIIRIEDDYRRS
jgi:mannose-1-phosphate guanylyltransferase/mannose-6-phosphate isomerase